MLLEYMEKLHEMQTIDDVWAHHVDQMAGFGFDRLLYGFTRFRTRNSFGDREDLLMLTNHSVEYMQNFIETGMYFNAPMVKWAAENVGACSWRWMEQHSDALTDGERQVVQYNRKMGITAGYSISFNEISSRSKGAIGLVARRGLSQTQVDALWAKQGRVIVQMNNIVHLKITTFPFPTLRRPLTGRQREALEWVGDGKTTQDIATIMGLTTPTIEKHLRLAREALDVETTAQAVLKASYQNQIFLLGS